MKIINKLRYEDLNYLNKYGGKKLRKFSLFCVSAVPKNSLRQVFERFYNR